MPDLPAEISRLKARVNKLAEEKSYLQLVIRLIERLNPLSGLDDMVRAMLLSIGEGIGGTDIKLYYWIGAELRYADLSGANAILAAVDDPLAAQAAESRDFIEIPADAQDNLVRGERLPGAWTWAFPLLVGEELVGVVKLENLLIGSAPLRLYLPIFFGHAALILSNTIRAHARQRAEASLAESESRFREIFNAVSDAIFIHDLETGRVVDVNRRMCEMYGYAREEALAVGDVALFSAGEPPHSGAEAAEKFRRLRAEGPQTFEWLARTRGGRLFWVEVSLRVAQIGGQPMALAVVRDISERRQAEARLRLAASVFANSYEGCVVADADSVIVDVNPAFTRITGYAREEAVGRAPSLLKSGRHDREFYEKMWKSLLESDFWRGEIWNRRKNGELYAEMLAISAVRDNAGRLQHYVAVFSDISEAKAHEAELDRIAYYDPLTGLPNRRLLADRLGQAITRARRNQRSLAVCYLDLDGFKPVNDQLGHAAGDRLLVEITERLKNSLRAGDTVARLGGDEFVLLLADLVQREEAATILDRVLASVGRPFRIDEAAVGVSASIGVTLFPADDADADTLLRHADQSMYRAKESGKNRCHFYDPGRDRRKQLRLQQLQRLRGAMEDGELVLYYQPKVDLVAGEIVGAEALIRWRHPEQGLLLPDSFLHCLQGDALEVAVGEWVIGAVLDQVALWKAQGLPLKVSANVSASHLLQADFAGGLARMIGARPGVEPADLELEILESAALADITLASRVLSECRALGVGLALDDFGTGYSSLTYFRRLPVDTLKIDQSFVRDILEDPDDLGIVESVVRLARAFNRQVIAEGAETEEHCARLVGLGCPLAQGFGIASPMPAALLPGWLAGSRYARPPRQALPPCQEGADA